MSFDLTKISAGINAAQSVLSIIPQLNAVAFNSLTQINQVLGSAGVAPTPASNAAALAAANKQILDTIALLGDIGTEINAILGVFNAFTTTAMQIVADAKAAADAAKAATHAA